MCWATLYGWRQSKTTGERVQEKVVVQKSARANKRTVAGNCTALYHAKTENDLEWKNNACDRKLHRMAKVHDFLEIWLRSQNLHATRQECRTQNKQLAAVESISDTEEIIKGSWSNIQHDCPTAFTLSERSPLPPALSPKDLPGGQSQVLNIRGIRRIDCHPGESGVDCTPESISDTDHWLSWNGD